VCEEYPRESLLVQIFETTIADPLGAFREVCLFLDVNDGFVPDNLGRKIGAYTTFRSLRVRGIYKSWLGEDSGPVRRHSAKAIAKLNSRRDSSYPPMDDGIREELAELFAEDNSALATWLGQDLSEWSH
jgi:hypothetical protein